LKERLHTASSSAGNTDFFSCLNGLKEQVRRKLENQDLRLIELNQRALIGEREAVLFCLSEIEGYLREKPFSGELPACYRQTTKVGALFQEWMGYGPTFLWFTDRSFGHSAKLQIIGKQIYYAHGGEYRPYPYEFSSLDRVEQLKRALVRHDPHIQLNHTQTSAEFKINDPLWPGRFLRVAIWVPPRVWEEFTTITVRRQIVEYLSLDDQVGTGLIPFEALEMIRALLQTYRNMIVAGPVDSGKTTFANTIVGEQLGQAEASTGVVMIEKHPESVLPYVIRGHRYIPIQAKDEELMEVGIESLRHDPDIVFLTEMRYREWEFYNFAGEKGHTGLIGTYHTTDAEDVPYQGAFAVYANCGGSLRGHLIAALKSCELVFVLEPQRQGRKKLTRISEIRYDPERQEVSAHDWMRWNPESDTWQYSADVSAAMLERMEKRNKTASRTWLNELSKLAAKQPLAQPVKISRKAQAVLTG
jgi:pilus assembly protein CpaF